MFWSQSVLLGDEREHILWLHLLFFLTFWWRVLEQAFVDRGRGECTLGTSLDRSLWSRLSFGLGWRDHTQLRCPRCIHHHGLLGASHWCECLRLEAGWSCRHWSCWLRCTNWTLRIKILAPRGRWTSCAAKLILNWSIKNHTGNPLSQALQSCTNLYGIGGNEILRIFLMLSVIGLDVPDELHGHAVDVVVDHVVKECLVSHQLFWFFPALLHAEKSAYCVQQNYGWLRWRFHGSELLYIICFDAVDGANRLRFHLLKF